MQLQPSARRSWGVCLAAALIAAGADWPTHRGNLARTGNVDTLAGPKEPRVQWVQKSREHFVASPVPGSKSLYVSGVGALNTAALHALDLDPAAKARLQWSKYPPSLRLPTVCPPAVADGQLIFGDGMHQTDGATLYCLTEQGAPLWRLHVPGELVHIESGPTVEGNRIYFGAGHAGVLCVDRSRLTLDGKELDLPAVRKLMQQKWQELLAAYEKDKKEDPDFAIPPTDDQLPAAAPRLVWQQGKGSWHVDAPVAVVGQRVLVASAYLDEENAGHRALLCLQAEDGRPQWRVALSFNPWSGPSVAGDLVLVGTSTIRFDPAQLANGRGELLAVALESGRPAWRQSLPGGVVSAVACTDTLAVCSTTDGKLRAYELASGKPAWEYDCGAPLFAGPAVAAGTAYVGDLKGVVHAVALSDGSRLWQLDLAAHPQVATPGMIFGSPVLHGGRLYLATCNLGGPAGRPTVIVCLGDE